MRFWQPWCLTSSARCLVTLYESFINKQSLESGATCLASGLAGVFWQMNVIRKKRTRKLFVCIHVHTHLHRCIYLCIYTYTYVYRYPIRRPSSAFSKGSMRQSGESSKLEILVQPRDPNPTSVGSTHPWANNGSMG